MSSFPLYIVKINIKHYGTLNFDEVDIKLFTANYDYDDALVIQRVWWPSS